MFSVNVAIGNVSWALVFNDEESAKEAYIKLTTARPVDPSQYLEIEDHYGQTLNVAECDVLGVMLEDWNKTKLGHIERALHTQRTQLEAQKRWERDPAAQTRSTVVQPGQMPFMPLRN